MTTQTASSLETETASSPNMRRHDDLSRWQQEHSAVVSLPGDLMKRYITVALRSAVPKQMDDGKWYCALDQFPGVWAKEESPKECLDTLEEVLREWLILKIVDRDYDIPVIDEIDLTVVSRRFVS